MSGGSITVRYLQDYIKAKDHHETVIPQKEEINNRKYATGLIFGQEL